jgi:hypothetical protein
MGAPLTCSLRFSRAREKRGTCRTGRRIPFCLFLFRDYGWGRMLARGRDGARAIGANAAAVGAGCGEGRAELRGRRLDGRRLLRTAVLGSVALSLYLLAEPRDERSAERHPPTYTRGRRRLAALS